MTRAIWVGAFAAVLLAVSPTRADLPPGPSPSHNLPSSDAPRRNGLFRSCGSGAGAGLAAIGVSWAVLWFGTRVAGRVRGTKQND